MAEFPTMVYKSPGRHKAGNGRSYSFKGVNSDGQLQSSLKEGWCITLEEALKDVKSELLAKAEQRGLKVDKRLSAEKIETMIEAHDEDKSLEALLSATPTKNAVN